MKKKLIPFLFVIVLGLSLTVKADEGMWLPMLVDRLNYVDMQKQGLKLTPEEIYSINKGSLKDAIVMLGKGFCSGSMISDEGLLLTAHHCGVRYIQANSTIERDYLTNGFWAMEKSEELANPGLTVSFLVRIENVTDKILKELDNNMTETSRKHKIEEVSKRIEAEAVANTNYDSQVKSFYEENEFYLFVYETFKDVRLVGAPPLSIGFFGGDADNWTWPRHTGDFSLFRIYANKDNKPAEYSPDNVPYKPKKSLPISITGVKENDFSMIMGYPAKTDRHLTSWGVKLMVNETNPSKIKIRDKKLAILKADMSGSKQISLKYHTKYLNTINYHKFYIGQIKGLKRLKVYEKKKEQESVFQNWANADPKRKEKYGTVLKDIEEAYKEMEKYERFNTYFTEVVRTGTDVTELAYKFLPLYQELNSSTKDEAKVASVVESLKETVRDYIKTFNLTTDKKVFAALFKMFYYDVSKDQLPNEFVSLIDNNFKADFDRFAEAVYSKSMFANGSQIWDFFKKPTVDALKSDLVFKTVLQFYDKYNSIYGNMIESNWKYTKAKRLYMEGSMEMSSIKKFYPDANRTMRLTYGKVYGYVPGDGLMASYYTTLKGVIEKEDPSNEEFIVSPSLKEHYKNKDYGRYAENDEMRVCFITNTDITGGNSGSGVINGNGELIGLIFDGNWEGVSGDIAYEPDLQRSINVDVRYILFVIDKYSGATNLINEMKIVKNEPEPVAPKLDEIVVPPVEEKPIENIEHNPLEE